MACGCNLTSPTSTYNAWPARPSCPLPTRTSTTPTVPQRFDWLPRVVPKESGKLLVANGDEMNALDSPVDGAVLFDAASGKAYVGTQEISSIPDNYGCLDTTPYGWVAYGIQPPCGSSTEFPAREIGFLRPAQSSTGTLYAHQRSCAAAGQVPEITPVEIIPDAWPSTVPADVKNLAVVKTPDSECGSAKYRFYMNPGQSIVPNPNLLLFDFPNRALTSTDDGDFRIAVFAKLDSDRFQLKSITNTSFQNYIDTRIGEVLSDEGYAPTYLNPRQTLVAQTSNEIFPYIYGPFDLSTYPGYNANSKEVQLYITSTALTSSVNGQVYNFYVKINGVRKYSSYSGPDPFGVRASGEVTVPIPVNKMVSIEIEKEIYVAGSSNPPSLGNIEISLEAFK